MTLKYFKFVMVAMLMHGLFTHCTTNNTNQQTPIIPKPDKVLFTKGAFSLNSGVALHYASELETETFLLKSYLTKAEISISKTSENSIQMEIDKNVAPNGYTLSIDKNEIVLKSGSLQGVKYGVQTLRQLLFYSNLNDNSIPCQHIVDAPNFDYRGMHLDVARHFMSVEFVKQYIDMLAILKMNYFHWHLVDDQGWRVEIKKYPKLTQAGSKRSETLIGHGRRPPFEYDGTPHEGFYTQAQIKEIVNYAEARGVVIIPEIELPGHAQAAIASYPELGCTGEQIAVWNRWGVSPYIYNVEESTFEFLEDVFDEVVALFPGKYIHIGGDEAVKDQWKASKKIQQRMKDLGIKDEAGLQSYFVNRVADYLRTKGKTIIGWDEILDGGAPEDAVVTFWRSWMQPSPALEAAENGHKIIFTPASVCYFDHYQTVLKDSIEPLAIGGCTPVDTLYMNNPTNNNLPEELQHLVWGAQGNVWTEYMKDADRVELMVMPRMAALAEILWTDKPEQNFDDFKLRFKFFAKWLKANNINYAEYMYRTEAQ